jgi:hypothetical protein
LCKSTETAVLGGTREHDWVLGEGTALRRGARTEEGHDMKSKTYLLAEPFVARVEELREAMVV